MAKRASPLVKRRRARPRVEATPALDRLMRKGTRALESALDAVAENPEEALQKGGAFVGRLLDTVDAARRSYLENPEAARREVRNMAVGALAGLGRKKRKKIAK